MRRPRKARAEGARPTLGVIAPAAPIEEAAPAAAEPAAEAPAPFPNPVPGDDGEALDRIAASFRARFPDDWAKLALCPLQHGLKDMARLMKGKG